MMRSRRSTVISHLLKSHDRGNGAGETFPVAAFDLELFATGASERVELGASVVLGLAPLGGDPPFLLELMERGIERAVADLQNVGRDLLETKSDRPAVHRLERQHFEDEKIQRPLNEVVRFAHGAFPRWPGLFISVTDMSTTTPLGKQEESGVSNGR